MNDCKYGHSFHGNLMTISLIKTGTYPDETADIGKHTFTYALLPHKGSWRDAGTVRAAYELNRPLTSIPCTGGGNLPSEFGLLSCDAENVMPETVKLSDSGEGFILRLYESQGVRTQTTLHFGARFRAVYETDLLEKPFEKIGEGTELSIEMKPYEIRTLLLV